MKHPAPQPVVPREQWLEARQRLLIQEKALTRQQDQIASQRRALPWVRIDKVYEFDTPDGRLRLDQLFEGKRQLLVQHFMLEPGAAEGCSGCSLMADHHDGMLPHLAARDVRLLAVSAAPLAEIERFRRRMGWRFPWVSSAGSDFNRDFGVSFSEQDRRSGTARYNYAPLSSAMEDGPGISVFYRRDDGTVFHTYSSYGRGVEVMMGCYPLLDLMPLGRDEAGLPHGMDWVRHHDRYEAGAPSSCCGA